jgi:membrane-associated phospholipid phosphatase
MKFSKIISFIFHPVLMPAYAFSLVLNFVPGVNNVTDPMQKIQLSKLIFGFTFFLPILSIIILKKMKLVSSYYMENKEERRFPLLIAIVCYYFLLQILERMYTHTILVKLLLGAMLILFVAAIVSRFWKISLHMLGIGGVLGAFLAIHTLFGGNIFLIITLLFCAGLIGFARVNENAHNLKQTYLGFIIGTCIEFLIFYF